MALDLAAVLLRLGGLLVPAHLTTKSGSCESGFRFLILAQATICCWISRRRRGRRRAS
jgi:uncharacterized membrane protein